MCCSKAKGRLTALQTPLDVLMQLLTEDTLKAKHFCGTIWKYNESFMMTSFGTDRDLRD